MPLGDPAFASAEIEAPSSELVVSSPFAAKRIAIVLPDLRGGGAERVGINLAAGMIERGYQVDIVLLTREGELLGSVPTGARVVDLAAPRVRLALLPLVRYLRSAKPDGVIASLWPLTVLTIVARSLSRKATRLVVVEHATLSKSEMLARPTVGWQIRNSMRLLFRKADAVVTVSAGVADDLARFAKLSRRAIRVIYNPIIGREPRPTRVPADPAGWCEGTHYRVLAVGTLKEIKDYPTLLDAFARMQSSVDARLLILGEGECRPLLETQIRRLGISDRVFMPGFVADPAPYFRHAHLHVLSSVAEGFGNVIVEALAQGTPVVSTDCDSGPREILAGGTFGTLVPVGDAEKMAQAMGAALRNGRPDADRLIQRAQDFTIDKAVDQYLSVMQLARTADSSQRAPS
jgi:glycosyltransferase involved in cell wall biosynthesis